MAKKYNVERGFISKLLEEKNITILKDQQIKPSFFTGDNRRVYQYILKTIASQGEIPTKRAILQKYPNFISESHEVDGKEITGTDESMMYWCEEIHTKQMHNRTVEAVDEVVDLLNDGKTQEAFAVLKKGVWEIENEVIIADSVDITTTSEDRILAYKDRKENKGITGILTGIEQLDKMLRGLKGSTLTTILASTAMGKTWLLVLIACYAMLCGKKVCLLITEMSTDLMQDRFDAMLFGMTVGEMNYSQFKEGNLPEKREEEYFIFLREILPTLTPLILESVTGVSSVVGTIEKHKPDLVLVDGAYLMEDDQGAKDDWLRVTNITRGLKQTAKLHDIPIVINTQADQKVSKKTGPQLGDIKYTQAIGQDSDTILAMVQDEIMRLDKEMMLQLLKHREGVLGKAIIQWDFSRMNFGSIYDETEESEDPSVAEVEDMFNKGVIGVD